MGVIDKHEADTKFEQFLKNRLSGGLQGKVRRAKKSRVLMWGGGPDETPPPKLRKLTSGSSQCLGQATPKSSGRKSQPTLFNVWNQSGPQVSTDRSPEWFTRSTQWKLEQEQRNNLALVPVSGPEASSIVERKVPSGGHKGGRPASGKKTGTASGLSSNRREMGAQVRRREPDFHEKLAICAKIESLASDPSSMATHLRRAVEQYSGFCFKQCMKWYRRKAEYVEQIAKYKIGKHSLRPFGSRASIIKRESMATTRIRSNTNNDNYQSEVFSLLQHWVEVERSHGHIITRCAFVDFYLKFLQRILSN